jgi:hypothetical protein
VVLGHRKGIHLVFHTRLLVLVLGWTLFFLFLSFLWHIYFLPN